MQEILASLDSDLERSKDASMLTKLDELYADNQVAGKDKFKTLRAIRAGNTRERVLMFENL